MTDNNPSGAPEAPAAESTAPVAGIQTPAGSFGSTRGSGLARGKRSQGAAAPKASAAPADYKPTAVQIITAQREYTNPFASPAPADTPAPSPAVIEAVAPTPAAEPVVASAPAPVPAPVAEAVPQAAPEVVETSKAEIQILPPAEVPRQSVSWESGPSAAPERPRRDERPTFKPDRRPEPASGVPSDSREPRRDNFRRQPRDPRDYQPRDPRDERPQGERREFNERRDPVVNREPVVPKSKGFFGWLKGLFGGTQATVETPSAPTGNSFQGDGQRHRRRHRGGRGHGGGPQGFRNDRPQGGDRPSDGQRPQGSGEFDGPGGGQRRRRHRGGRGRNRGGEPRPEGHQGGGAI